MKYYTIAYGSQSFFVVKAKNKKLATREGVREYGRGSDCDVREAKRDEITHYAAQRTIQTVED